MVWLFHHVIVPLAVIGVLVIVHELGHFLLAKLCGVGVVKFSIGFGPAIFRFTHRETIYQLGLIPFGGFVRMVGDIPDMLTGDQLTDEAVREDEALAGEEAKPETPPPVPPELEAALHDRSRWFIEKGFWQRSAIVVAGPLFNYVLAIVVVAFAVLFYGRTEVSDEPVIGGVLSGSPAAAAGIKSGDRILSIDSKPINTWLELAQTVHDGTGASIAVQLRRAEGGQEQEQTRTVQPQQKELPFQTGEKKKVYLIGIEPSTLRRPAGILESAKSGLIWTLDKTLLTYAGLWGMITGKVSPKDLAGPIFIIDAAGKESREGFDSLLYFVALLSVSLAVLNLLPIPILDGGHLLFFIIEALIGPVSMRKKEFAQQVGMIFLLALMAFAIRNDIVRDRDALKRGPSWDNAAPAQSGESPQDPAQPAEENTEEPAEEPTEVQ